MNATPRDLAAAVQAALARGALDEAASLCLQWQVQAPEDANAWLLGGIAAHRGGDAVTAIEALSRASALAPNAPQPRYWLGLAAHAGANTRLAESALRETLALSPQHADAAFNLGALYAAQGRHEEAGPLFVRSGREAPELGEAYQQVVEQAAALSRAGKAAPTPTAASTSQPLPFLSFIVCSIDAIKLARFTASLEATFAPNSYELIAIRDARSLYDGFKRGTARATSNLLVYCHDDIEFLAPDFQARLSIALEDADLVGVCGTTRVTGPAVAWTGSPHVHGWMTHLDGSGGFLPSISSLASARVDGAQAIDGVFMATHRHVVETIGFDTQQFDGFHLYDMDFSYRAFRAGFRLRVQNDLLIAHASLGNFNADYWRYAERFLAKHPELVNAPHGASAFYQVDLPDIDHARRFYGWIAHWLDAPAP